MARAAVGRSIGRILAGNGEYWQRWAAVQMHSGPVPAPKPIERPRFEYPARDVDRDVAMVEAVSANCPWPYAHRSVDIVTCGNLYRQWKAEGRIGWKTAPEEGVRVTVPYIHTGLDRTTVDPFPQAKRPRILILTGAPGSYLDFTEMIPFLTEVAGADVVCPNWPDLTFSHRTKCFWHSADEKTQYLVDFLKAINHDSFDMVVSHSSAFYPCLNVLTRPNMPTFKSCALISPAGHLLVRALRPEPVMRTFALLYTNPKMWNMMNNLGKMLIKLTNNPIKPNMHDAYLTLFTMVFSDYRKATDKLLQLKGKKFPMLLTFGENDRAISPSVNFKMAELMMNSNEWQDDIWKYDEKGEPVNEGCKTDYIKVLTFKKGGHYPFRKHPNVVHAELLALLQKALA